MATINQLILLKETQSVVKSLARRIAGKDKDLEKELVQEACSILLVVAKYYDPQRGVPFWGFAHAVLKHALPKKAKKITRILSFSEQDAELLDELGMAEMNDSAWAYFSSKRDACSLIPIDDEEDFPRPEIRDCNPTPYERYELEDMRRAIRKAVKLLPRNERIAITLFYGLDGLYYRPYINIAKELNCSEEGARKACERGVKKLSVYFGEPVYALCA